MSTTTRTEIYTGHWIKVYPVGMNFGYVAEVQYRNGRTIATTEAFANDRAAFYAACDIAAEVAR